jgi:hypothetical protein
MDANSQGQSAPKRYDIDYYKALPKGIIFSEIEKIIGQPDSDIGSGVHIYVYKQNDGSEVWLGYRDPDTLLYVKQKLIDDSIISLVPFQDNYKAE